MSYYILFFEIFLFQIVFVNVFRMCTSSSERDRKRENITSETFHTKSNALLPMKCTLCELEHPFATLKKPCRYAEDAWSVSNLTSPLPAHPPSCLFRVRSLQKNIWEIEDLIGRHSRTANCAKFPGIQDEPQEFTIIDTSVSPPAGI